MSSAPEKERYLTSRDLNRAVARAFREASEHAKTVTDSLVVAKDGWIVRKHTDGRIEKIERIPDPDPDRKAEKLGLQ